MVAKEIRGRSAEGTACMNTNFEISLAAKKRYVERRKVDLASCFKSLENSEFSFLQNIGHQLSGNGISFGLNELSRIGAELETAAQEKDLSKCKFLVEELSHQIALIDQNPNLKEAH